MILRGVYVNNNDIINNNIDVIIRGICCYDCKNRGECNECEIYGKIPNSILKEQEDCSFFHS